MIRLFTISLLLALCACADEQTELDDASRALRFGVEEIEDTKGVVTTTQNIRSMSVFCAHTGKEQYSSTATSNWMHNAQVTRTDENSEWTIQGIANKQWKDDGYHSFFAFAPHAPEGAVVSNSSEAGPPTLTYTVPADYTKQVDLLYSQNTLINGKQMYIGSRPVSFGFRHALSKITFDAKKEVITDDVTITEIQLTSIINKAQYKFIMNTEYTNVDDINRITESGGTITFSILPDKKIGVVNTLLLPKDQALFMINQSFTDNNKLIITYNKGSETGKTITANLLEVTPAGGWDISKAYRYSILIKEDKVTVTAQIQPWEDQVVDVAVPGTYLDVSSTNIAINQGEASKIFYSTDGEPVDVICDKGISFDHNKTNKYISIPSTTPIGDYIFTITAGKLSLKVFVKVTALPYIQIGNLYWATGNLVANGPNSCKIGQPQDGGLYFQWGSLIGWTGGANGDGTGTPDPSLTISQQVKPYLYAGDETWTSYWPGYIVSDIPENAYGDPCRYYLGNGWRLPSADEYSMLYPQGLDVPTNSVSGQWHGLDVNKRIWFENAGYRGADLGVLHYWSISWEATYWCHLNNQCRYFLFYPTSASVGVESVNALGYPIRCVKSTSIIDNDFIAESGVAAPRIFVDGEGDNAKLMLTKKPTNYGAYFQFMGITAWEYDNSIKYQPYIVTTDDLWTSSSAHDITSLKAGKGDPCRLVGYTQKQVQDLVDAGIVPDNGKWKTPVHTPGSDSEINQPKPDGWVIISGVKGHYYTVNTLVEFLPAAGFSWCGGNLINKNSTGAYWTSTVASYINKGESLRLNENSLVGNFNQEHGARMSVRCVRQ